MDTARLSESLSGVIAMFLHITTQWNKSYTMQHAMTELKINYGNHQGCNH